MTMGERVGSIFSITLALHNAQVAEIFNCAHDRQRTKYQSFSTPENIDDHAMYYEQYLHTMSPEECRTTLTHLCRHGFDLNLLEKMDVFQINQLIHHTSCLFERTVYPDSYPEFDNINGVYVDMGDTVRIKQSIMNQVCLAMNPQPDNILQKHRLIPVMGVVSKHFRRKPKHKGDGSTCAFLGTQIFSLIMFLEYALCYHSFCKYSSTLPESMRNDHVLIDFSGRSLLLYFSKMIYRGDGTIDSRTTKIHAQKRLGLNFHSLGNVMHSCCEVGERLLKTEAKKISRTAQQRGSTTFERQTCSRILDRHLLEKMKLALETAQNQAQSTNESLVSDKFTRQHPHFIVTRENAMVLACDRKGSRFVPDERTGKLDRHVVEHLLETVPDLDEINVYNEVILRDGSYVRAYPNYRGEGRWYDFVSIQWEDEKGEPYLLPAQCHAFYHHNNECHAIVHSVDLGSAGKVTGYKDSVLISHYNMQYSRSGLPVLYSVNCASIDCTVFAIDHDPNRTSIGMSKRSVMITRPRNEWAYAWYVWNKYLKVKNGSRSMTRPFVSLGTEEMVVRVRMSIDKVVKEHGKA